MTGSLLRSLLRTFSPLKTPYRRLLRTLLRSTSLKKPSKNPSKKRVVAWPLGVHPTDTILLLTSNGSEIMTFKKLRFSHVIPRKSRSFPEILRVQNPSKFPINNSQVTIFVIRALEPRLEPRLEARYPLRAFGGFVPISGARSLFLRKLAGNCRKPQIVGCPLKPGKP